MNLDLGNVIWLDVSRRLLSFHKYFFIPFDNLPKQVQAEFRHHSHTHPDATVTSDTVTHTHITDTGFTQCGNPDPEALAHRHNLTGGVGDSHNHSVSVSFGAANLGSPNWWEHVHPVSLVTWGSGGAVHTHGITVNTTIAGCLYGSCNVAVNRHYHSTSGYNFGNGGGSHVHTLPSGNSGNASSGETPENHRHSFTITGDAGNAHTHPIGTITVAYELCYYGYNHNHTAPSTSVSTSHTHVLTGYSGYGGEAPVVVPKMLGDGLTWV